MAAVEITVNGILYDKLNRTTQNVVLVGEASLTGVGVGGGPVYPPQQPPGIWGPTDPRPTPPIANVPGIPNPNPPGWGAHPSHPIMLPGMPGWGDPHPEHPIVIPPIQPPSQGGGSPLPPAVNVPIHGYIVFVPGYGWTFIPDKGGSPEESNPEKQQEG